MLLQVRDGVAAATEDLERFLLSLLDGCLKPGRSDEERKLVVFPYCCAAVHTSGPGVSEQGGPAGTGGGERQARLKPGKVPVPSGSKEKVVVADQNEAETGADKCLIIRCIQHIPLDAMRRCVRVWVFSLFPMRLGATARVQEPVYGHTRG